MEYYASAVPGSLDDLVPEERHQVYKMLRLEVLAFPDKSLEVSGAILAGGSEDQDDGLDRVGPDGGRFDAASPTGAGLGALGSSRSFANRPYRVCWTTDAASVTGWSS